MACDYFWIWTRAQSKLQLRCAGSPVAKKNVLAKFLGQFWEVSNEQAHRSGCYPGVRHGCNCCMVGIGAGPLAVPADRVFRAAAREGSVADRADAKCHTSARRQQSVPSPSWRTVVDDPGGRDHLHGP